MHGAVAAAEVRGLAGPLARGKGQAYSEGMRKRRRTRGAVEQRVVLATRWQQRDPNRRGVMVRGDEVLCYFDWRMEIESYTVGTERTVDALEAAVEDARTPAALPSSS